MNIYLQLCISLFGYLFIANIVYVYRKLSNLPYRVQCDKKMMLATILCETFRTLYLTMGGVTICFKFWAQDTRRGGYYEDLKIIPCTGYRYINIFVQSGIIILLRFLFTYSRLYQIRRMMQMNFGKWNAVILTVLMTGEIIAIILTLLMAEFRETTWNGAEICWVGIPPHLEALWIAIITLFEIVMLWLYIYPLIKLDNRLGGGLKNIFVYQKFRKDKTEKFLTEDFYHGLSLESTTASEQRFRSISAPIILKRYHRSVRRNFWSGILCAALSIQYSCLSLSSSNDSSGEELWYTGLGIIHMSLSFFLIYGCLVLSYRDWSIAFVPCRGRYSRFQSVSERDSIQRLNERVVYYEKDTKTKEENPFRTKKMLSFEIS